jgi:hypothetical protein
MVVADGDPGRKIPRVDIRYFQKDDENIKKKKLRNSI